MQTCACAAIVECVLNLRHVHARYVGLQVTLCCVAAGSMLWSQLCDSSEGAAAVGRRAAHSATMLLVRHLSTPSIGFPGFLLPRAERAIGHGQAPKDSIGAGNDAMLVVGGHNSQLRQDSWYDRHQPHLPGCIHPMGVNVPTVALLHGC